MTKKVFPMEYAKSTVPPTIPVASTLPVEPLVVTKVVDHSVAIEKAKAKERQSLTRGLSRYGPWGYLMLGMLLCGGALLICGLWGKHQFLSKWFNAFLISFLPQNAVAAQRSRSQLRWMESPLMCLVLRLTWVASQLCMYPPSNRPTTMKSIHRLRIRHFFPTKNSLPTLR